MNKTCNNNVNAIVSMMTHAHDVKDLVTQREQRRHRAALRDVGGQCHSVRLVTLFHM